MPIEPADLDEQLRLDRLDQMLRLLAGQNAELSRLAELKVRCKPKQPATPD